MESRVLVLNSDYSPLHVTNARRAIILMLTAKVDVLKVQDDVFWASANDLFEIPSIIRLKYYVKRPYHDVPLTKANIHERDNHQCQYCGSTQHLTLDHVLPLKRGGERTWENLVTACFDCNNKKGDIYPPEKAGLVLMNKPKRPSRDVLFRKVLPKGMNFWDDILAYAS